jgi:hypothetical protein
MNTTPSFASLSAQHEELEREFDAHQRALLASDVGAAVAASIR